MFQRSGKQIKSQSPDSGVAGLRELKKKSIFNGCSPNFKIKHITFLRVRFQLLYIYDRNGTICPPLQSIKARLIRKRKFPLSLTGHTHMIKKKTKTRLHSSHLLPQNFDFHFKRFPHKLFIFHSSPTLNGTIISFIWNHKTLRIKKKQINPPRGEKGDGSCQLLNCRIGLASKHGFLFQQLSQWGEMNGYDRES